MSLKARNRTSLETPPNLKKGPHLSKDNVTPQPGHLTSDPHEKNLTRGLWAARLLREPRKRSSLPDSEPWSSAHTTWRLKPMGCSSWMWSKETRASGTSTKRHLSASPSGRRNCAVILQASL